MDHSRNRMLNNELWISRWPLYSMKPNFLNLFMKRLTRARRADDFGQRLWLIGLVIGSGPPSWPKFASRRVRAAAFA